jgi:hypothetical protein
MKTGTIVVLRGLRGKLGRPDEKNTGPWAAVGAGWRGLIWDGTDKADARYHHVVTEVGDDYVIAHQANGGAFGIDGTQFSGDVGQQFYYKPDGDTAAGFAETIRIYDGNANGALQGQVEYAPGSGGDDGAFFGCSVAIEVVQEAA